MQELENENSDIVNGLDDQNNEVSDNDNFKNKEESLEENVVTKSTEDAEEEKVLQFTQSQLNELFNKRAEQAKRSVRREYDKRLEEIEAKIPKNQRPTIPDLPDPYDVTDNQYKELVEKRDKAIREAAAWDARKDYEESQRNIQREQRQKEEKELFNRKVTEFENKSKSVGIDPINSIKAINANFGVEVSQGVFQLVAEMDNGPQILDYLAKNPSELSPLIHQRMDLVALKLAGDISSKVKVSKKTSNAPNPPSNIEGNSGVSSFKAGPLSSGGTFE